jgi:hypothetical protein
VREGRHNPEVSTVDGSLYWRAVGQLRFDRRAGLRGLERCFSEGQAPDGLDGPLRGRLVATTIGHGTDGVFEAMARGWLPWQGKTFAGGDGEGRNLFTTGAQRMMRVTLPNYQDVRDEGGGHFSAFRFLTSVGPSALDPGVDVLRIDYRDVAENPAWPVRQVLDELVTVGPRLYLGQALLLWRGSLRRAAWFSLEGKDIGDDDH